MTRPVLLVVDAANVVGARPDGWWRDRAGATRRLRDELSPISTAGLPGLPPPVEVVLVVEGAARRTTSTDRVRVVPAPGSGDDAIVELLRAEPPERRASAVVVTADRALRERVAGLGARVHGPRWVRPGPEPRDRPEPERHEQAVPERHRPPGNRTATPEAPSGGARPETG